MYCIVKESLLHVEWISPWGWVSYMFKANWFDQIKTESFTRVLKNDVDGYKANQIMISVNALQVFIPIQNPTKKGFVWMFGLFLDWCWFSGERIQLTIRIPWVRIPPYQMEVVSGWLLGPTLPFVVDASNDCLPIACWTLENYRKKIKELRWIIFQFEMKKCH